MKGDYDVWVLAVCALVGCALVGLVVAELLVHAVDALAAVIAGAVAR